MNNNNYLKKVLLLFLILIILTFSQTTFAEGRLTQTVAGIIGSGKFAIKYRSKELISQITKHKDKQRDGRTYTYLTLVKDGENTLVVIDFYEKGIIYDSCSRLLTNGKTYSWATKGNGSSVDSDFKPTTKIIHQHGKEESALVKESIDNDYREIGRFLLPIMPEFRDVYANYYKKLLETYPQMKGYNGNSFESFIKIINDCVVFSKTGEQNIGGEIYQYEEYKTPSKRLMNFVGRYYFKDGKLKKYVQLLVDSPKAENNKQGSWGYTDYDSSIDTGSVWKKACEQEESENGGWLVDIQVLCGDFDSSCLQMPIVKQG